MRPGVIIDLASLVNLDAVLAVAQRTAADSVDVAWDFELAHALAGQPLAAMAQVIADRAAPLSDARLADLDHTLRARLDALVWAGELQLLPDAGQLLEELSVRRRLPLAIVSTLPSSELTAYAERIGLRRLVDTVVGSDPGDSSPPSLEWHRAVFDELAIDGSGSVAIKHTAAGVDAAWNAGLFVVTDPSVDRIRDHTLAAVPHLASYRSVNIARLLSLADRRQTT
jgi:beta-phosphoglucomutase-like phosphatase (HAD superfamily)